MATLLISDFRGQQLQYCDHSNDIIFITDDSAEYSWFVNSAAKQLPLYPSDRANVIIMLGFNDCVYSCVWNAFNIDQIALDYARAINKVKEEYPAFKFYVCAVCPVDADYPFYEYKNGAIPSDTLDTKIKQFNNKIKENCNADFIDCYGYLSATSFFSRDGVRYSSDTCDDLLSYIMSYVDNGGGTVFKPRLTAPVVNDNDIESDLFWLGDSYGGLNPFDDLGQTYAKCKGDTLPNCTAYAWGRFYELIGTRPKLSTGNAEQWWGKTSDGYKRGQTPAIGAVMCWQKGATTGGSDGAGHVAIVEQVNPDGSVVTSESGWNDSRYWWSKTRTRGSDGNWGAGTGYTFQGFIYCPTTAATTKEELCVRNSYGITLDEMKPNAKYIWQYLGARGWSINAVAGLLGNLQQESKMSPAVWESLIEGSTINADGTHTLNMTAINTYYANRGRYPGYGITQWTPYSKYTNWCKNENLPYWEMDSQLLRLEWEAKNKQQWIAKPSKGYDITFDDFITSSREASWLAAAFAFCYERPARSTGTQAEQEALRKERGDFGQYWYNFLSSLPPISSNTALTIDCIKLTACSSSNVEVSFVARNANTVSYMLNGTSQKAIQQKEDFTTFTLTDLIPNKQYTITLTAAGNNAEVTKTFSFTTPQAYPESIRKITLAAKDSELPNDNFQISTAPAKPDFGYYSTNSHGYTVQLIVNGAVKREKNVNFLQTSFSVNKYFGYKLKLGDVIQIGVRTWVKNDDGDLIYDNDFIKASNPICMLAKPVTMYLNID
jgi:surface antigen